MSKEKKVVVPMIPAETSNLPVAAAPLVPVSAPVPSEKLSDTDRLALDLARSKRQVALAEAKTALANNENAELNYRYLVLQLYMKYGLNHNDALSETGEIVRGGAIQPPTK